MIVKANGLNQGDLFDLLQALTNRLVGNPGLAGQGSALVDQQNNFDYCIGNQIYSRTAADFALTGISTAAGQFRKVRFEVDAAGTITATGGPVAASQAEAEVPRRTANRCTIGWMEMPASFTGGTTNTNAANCTYYNGDPDTGPGSGVPPNARGIDQTVQAHP